MVRLWALEEEKEEEEEEEAANGVDGLDFEDLSSFVFDDDEEEDDDDDAAAASADERAATAAIRAAVMGTRMRPLGSGELAQTIIGRWKNTDG